MSILCPKCKTPMKPKGTVDNNWRFYQCPKCNYESAKHIHCLPDSAVKEVK